MAKPEYYDLLGIPSEEEERTRTVLSSPAPASYGSYYQSFQNRRQPAVGGYGMPQRRVGVREWEQAQKKAAYEQNARRTLQQLTQIDPADPELTLKQEQLLMSNPYGQDLVRDPRVTSVLKNRFSERAALEKQFQDDPDSQTDYLIARQEGLDHRTAMGRAAQSSALRKDRIWFAEKGGDLEEFDSGRFMQNGRFDKAAAAARINQLTASKKNAEKPWQERLSFKEGEAIRNAARAAKQGLFDDFETEFTEQTTKKDEPFKGTRDEYVKQFKGVPDFNAYRQRRLLETGQSLMDEYGLNAEEAAQVLGIRPQMASAASLSPSGADIQNSRLSAVQGLLKQGVTDPAQVLNYLNRTQDGRQVGDFTQDEVVRLIQQANPGNLDSSRPVRGPEAMFEGQKDYSTGQPATAAPIATTPVSQADLKRVEPVSFESLRQQRQAEAEGAKRAREEEFLNRQKQTQATSNQWEAAKQELLQTVTPADLDITELDFTGETPTNPYAILSRMGKKETDVAFTDPNGKTVTWGGVLTALVSDPRWKGESAQSSSKDFSSLWGGRGK